MNHPQQQAFQMIYTPLISFEQMSCHAALLRLHHAGEAVKLKERNIKAKTDNFWMWFMSASQIKY